MQSIVHHLPLAASPLLFSFTYPHPALVSASLITPRCFFKMMCIHRQLIGKHIDSTRISSGKLFISFQTRWGKKKAQEKKKMKKKQMWNEILEVTVGGREDGRNRRKKS
ncbi:hypothetical protein E2C01_077552 [Portunus trituberculatus]|uniref:Uncharacterized protein n=1 Tax=Portunus trituberculatus TaxID=210409 RepID=A0A5B7IML6_PORTR|nr:hypothetical protein [Portunus trituberculatus]